MLDKDKQKAIEMLVEGGYTITAIAKEIGIVRSTMYEWMKRDDFKAKLSEMQELKNDVLKENVKGNAEDNIRVLEQLRDNSANDMTRYHAANVLLGFAGWNDKQTHEVTIKNDESDQKNYLLELLNKKKQQKEEEE